MSIITFLILLGRNTYVFLEYTQEIRKRAEAGLIACLGDRKSACKKPLRISCAQSVETLGIALSRHLFEKLAEIGWVKAGDV